MGFIEAVIQSVRVVVYKSTSLKELQYMDVAFAD